MDRPRRIDQRIGATLRALREAQGIHLRQLAESSGVARSKVSRIERGEQEPDQETLARLVAGLGGSMVTFWLEIERQERAA